MDCFVVTSMQLLAMDLRGIKFKDGVQITLDLLRFVKCSTTYSCLKLPLLYKIFMSISMSVNQMKNIRNFCICNILNFHPIRFDSQGFLNFHFDQLCLEAILCLSFLYQIIAMIRIKQQLPYQIRFIFSTCQQIQYCNGARVCC